MKSYMIRFYPRDVNIFPKELRFETRNDMIKYLKANPDVVNMSLEVYEINKIKVPKF